jgi:hypothetical protein
VKHLLFFLLFPYMLYGTIFESQVDGDFSASVVISADEIPITEIFSVQITSRAPATYRLDSKKIRKQILEGMNTVIPIVTLIDESVAPQKIVYKFVTKIPGNYYINFLKIPFVSDTAPEKELLGKVFPIHATAPENISWKISNEVQGIETLRTQSQVDISTENRVRFQEGDEVLSRAALSNAALFAPKPFPYLQIVLACGVIIGVVALFFASRYVMNVVQNYYNDPRRIALRELKQVHTASDECYEHLTKILRGYIEDKYNVPARHLTSEEIESKFNRDTGGTVKRYSYLSQTMLAELKELLEGADAIKFSELSTSEEERRETLRRVSEFILQ